MAAVLLQYYLLDTGARTLHPVAYHLRKITTAEYNYNIGNKELLAIIKAF